MKVYKNDFWGKKSIIWNFAITDLKLRYKNSVLGFAWTFLEPLLLLSVLYIVFTNVFESTIEYFPLYLLQGIILYNMLAKGTQIGVNSIQAKSQILTQIKTPMEFPPISASITALIMLAFELIVFGMFLVAFQFIPPVTIVVLPLVIMLEFILILGLALPLSVLNVKYKDVQFIWGVIIHAGFFLTPIFYSIDILPQQVQSILIYSPMVQIVNIAHDATLYGILPTLENIVIALGMTFLVFGIGYGIFRKFSSRIVEEL